MTVRHSVLWTTLAGLLAVSLLGQPVGLCALLAAVVGALRLFMRRPLPDGLWNLLILVGFAGIALWVGGVAERVPAALGMALVVLQIQRLWQCRSGADEKVLVALAFIQLILVGTQTTSPVFLVAWVGWLGFAPFVLMGPLLVSARLQAWVLVALFSVSALLFVTLPRFQSPALEPGMSTNAVIGFAEDITLGDLGELLEDTTPVLRVRVDQTVSEPMYLRGVSMDHFDGVRWKRTGQRKAFQSDVGLESTATLEVLAEPGTQGVLFTMGRVQQVRVGEGQVWSDEDDNWFVDGPAGSKRYTIRTDLNGTYREDDVDPRWLQVTESVSADLADFASTVMAGATTPAEKMEAAQNWLKANAAYTRAPRDEAPEDPVRTFLLDKRVGHCEYFASALALLLRLEGVPARVVNGFLGGEYNELGGYWIVRQSHAHAWVEALDETQTWRRLDATPQEIAPALLGSRWHRWSETVDWWWTNQIVAYDRKAQWQLAKTPIWSVQNLFSGAADDNDTRTIPWFGLLICVSCLVGIFIIGRRIWRRQQDRWLGSPDRLKGVALLHENAWVALQGRGWRAPEGMPKLVAAQWMAAKLGRPGEDLEQLVWLHYRVQFGGESDTDLHSEALALWNRIERATQADRLSAAP